MKRSSWFKFLSIVTVAVLLMAVVVVLTPSRPTSAATGAEETATRAARIALPKPEGTDKVLIVNVAVPETIAAFQGTADATGTLPEGIFEGAVSAPAGGQIEMFVPIGMNTSLYVFGPTGYHFIQTVAPTGSNPITVDASKAMTASSVLTFTVPSLATKGK